MSISVNDGKVSPAAHVFTQDAQQNGPDPSEFVNRSNTNGPSFWERLRAWCTLGAKATQPHVVKLKLSRPIAGTVDGNPAVLGKHEAILTLLIDQKVASESDVKDTLVMMANLLDNAELRSDFISFAPLTA